MENATPASLPAFLDPLLDALPEPLYSFTITFLSHSIALIAAVYDISSSLLSSSNTSRWDAQTLIPPIISILAAYLALISLYRTTSWMFRLSFWFIKWGSILGVLVGGIGWLLGSSVTPTALAGAGLLPTIGNLLLQMMGDESQRTSTRRSGRSQSTRSSNSRETPRAWHSFEDHRQWREATNAQDGGTTAEDILKDLSDVAKKYVNFESLGGLAKTFARGLADGERQEEGGGGGSTRRQPHRKAKAKAKAKAQTGSR